MSLLRQIGSTDADALLAASGGKVGDTMLNPTDPAVLTPVPVATSVAVPVPLLPTIDPSLQTLLWAGLGLGVGWWLGKSDEGDGVTHAGTVGKGSKSLIPLFVIGGLAAWYFLTPKEDPAITARLLSWSTGAPQFPALPSTVAALSIADRATLYTIITQYFDKGVALPGDLQTFWNTKLAAATT